ncbi:MAG: hypothetical protein Q9183_001491 [Haloplaca sp. 2 TL-2023]
MGSAAAMKTYDGNGQVLLQDTPDKPLKKKKSLTKLFTSSRSSSRSRPTSVSDADIPSTPTIPEQFLPTSRKASNADVLSEGGNRPGQPGYADNISPSISSEDRNDGRKPSLRGVLKPKTSTTKIYTTGIDHDSTSTLNAPMSSHLQTLSGSRKRRNRRPTVPSSPPVPGDAKEAQYTSTTFVSPAFPSRARGASTTSLKRCMSPASQTANIVPPRPSTSGGERQGRSTKECGLGGDDLGLGLSLESRPRPIPASDGEIRTSLRSAMTTSSDTLDRSTARSSVATRITSPSDVTVDSSRADVMEEGMTVDEAIGMYENGFEDDATSDHEHLSGSSVSDEERRRSVKIAEAINDTIGSESPHKAASLMTGRHDTATTLSKRVPRSAKQRAPPIMPPTTTRDQYGFLKANRYISVEQYDAWNHVYTGDQVRRTKKWCTYMREQGCTIYYPDQFPDRSPKTMRYIRKGIPPAWRGAAWFYYSGGAEMLKENPHTYSTLLSRSETSDLTLTDIESIERDLHRTFPDNIHFKPDQPAERGSETALLSSLRRVLQAFAIHRPQIGYCQSLNFLAGLLLLFLPEEKTFWMLHIITHSYLPGTHELSLEGANVDLWVLMLALKESSPSMWAKVGVGGEEVGSMQAAHLPPISLCTTSWFMSMFIGTLPIESVLRVWDTVFYEGSKMLFRIALAIFKMGEQRIRDVSDSMELFQVVQALPRGILDIGVLMSLACRRGGISQEWIAKKRKERRKWYSKEKAKVAGAVTPADISKDSSKTGSPSLSRANSVWKRRVGLKK